MYYMELNNAIDNMGFTLPNVRYMIIPIIDTANNLQTSITDANIKYDDCTSKGCWNVFLSANEMTEDLHT